MSVVYHKRYFINFMGMPDESSSGRSYRVEFYKRGDSADAIPEVVELQGSGSPFLQSLNDSEDLLAPLRTSTARISFIDDISLQELSPKDAFEWQVRLLRLDDSKQLFIGYLTAEVYTQPNIEGPNVVTVNAASPLTPIAATTMQLVDVGSLSIGRLLHMALSECEGVDSVYIPAMYTINKATSLADFTDILHWQFSSSNFIKMSDSGIVTGELFECDTYSAALEAICKLFGWSLTDVGDGSLYFVSPGYTGRYMRIGKYQLLASGFVPTVVSPTIIDEGYLFPVDSSNTIDFRQGVGSAVVKADSEDASLGFLDFESIIYKQVFTRKQYYATIKLSSYGYAVETATVATTTKQGVTTLYQYYLDNKDAWVEVSERLHQPTVESGWAGVDYQKIDWCNPDDLKESAENRKRDWNLSGVLYIRDGGYNGLVRKKLPQDYPLLKMETQGGMFHRGAIKITGAVMASPKPGFYIPKDNYYQGGQLVEPATDIYFDLLSVTFPFWGESKSLRVSLKIGDKYYDGTKWTQSKAIFSIPISVEEAQWHNIETNKTIDMPYAGSDGFYIPINEKLAGMVEFCLYPSFITDENLTGGILPSVYIKDFAVSYENNIDNLVSSIVESTYYKAFNSSFKGSRDVELPLHSRINSTEQMSLIYDSTADVIDTLWRTTATEAAKPEQFLLANIERLYSRPLTSWRTATSLREVTPFDMFSKPDGVLPLMGYTINYAVGVIELHLTKVESEKELRYVE